MRQETKTRREFINWALYKTAGLIGVGGAVTLLAGCAPQKRQEEWLTNLGNSEPKLPTRSPVQLQPALVGAPQERPTVELVAAELSSASSERRPPVLLTEARPILSESDPFLQQELPLLQIPTEASFASARIEHQLLLEAGFSELQAGRLNANLPAYLEAENLTGIPWKVLAAIHRVETSLSTVNPTSEYGRYGPFQVTEMASGSGKHVLGHQNTFQEFVDLMVNEAIPAIRMFAENVGVNLGSATLEDWAKVAYAYNGMPPARVGPDGKTYYGSSSEYYYRSGYVMNNYGDHQDMYVKWWGGGWVQMKHDGFLRSYEKLEAAERAQGRIKF